MKHKTQPTFWQKLQYRYEQFIGKGGVSIFLSLLILFVVGFLFVWVVRTIAQLLSPDASLEEGITGLAWRTFMEMIDAGTLDKATDNGSWVKFISTISILIGLVVFSALVAIITTALDATIANFQKGRGKVWETQHTLILGWNERVADILRELIIANESQKSATVVIMAEQEKEAMDDELNSRIDDFKTTKIVTTPAYPAALAELKRVQAGQAKSVIILASCTESASLEDKENSDNQVIKTIMALIAAQDGQNKIPIIAEIFLPEKREIVRYFNDNNIVSLDSWNIMGKLLVQTSLTGGLEMVYNELFGFDGSELYFYQNTWNNVAFYDLAYHFPDGVPIGIKRADGQLIIHPNQGTTLANNDELLILANDDSAIQYQSSPLVSPKKLPISTKKLQREAKRILMLGWHDISHIFIEESIDYLKEGSSFDIMFEDEENISQKLTELRASLPNFQLNFIEGNPMHLEDLLRAKPFEYDNILILSQDSGEQEAEKIDSDTLMILLLLRKIKRDSAPNAKTKILTQILNSDNQELIQQTEVDDFLISNKMITKILAQLSEQPRLQEVYHDLFSAEGSEIYVKPLYLYLDKNASEQVNFADLIAVAEQRKEICIGLRLGAKIHDANQNFGIVLNPSKTSTYSLSDIDALIVIAEDEQ
ncbi:MAG: CASTOR/POLLUX-related putative ion channel [Bacteroidia bacterium]